MKFPVILIATLPFFIACTKTKKDCPTDTYTFTFKENSRVDTATYPNGLFVASIAPGNKITFFYKYEHQECPEIADGISGELLMFQVDPGVSHFKYYTDSLDDIRCYFRSYCIYGCYSPAFIPTGGIIEGTKLSDDLWKINFDVKLSSTRTFTTSFEFKKE